MAMSWERSGSPVPRVRQGQHRLVSPARKEPSPSSVQTQRRAQLLSEGSSR